DKKGFIECMGYRKGGRIYVKCYTFPGRDELHRRGFSEPLYKIADIVEKGSGLVPEEHAQEYKELMQKVEEILRVCVVEVK
ncbi:MAG: hypothetical protein J7J91_06695, partial [Deltaproteobacteria bacterium]|nr:hypothetical protein [Deltaproteobacteria bacterium]